MSYKALKGLTEYCMLFYGHLNVPVIQVIEKVKKYTESYGFSLEEFLEIRYDFNKEKIDKVIASEF